MRRCPLPRKFHRPCPRSSPFSARTQIDPGHESGAPPNEPPKLTAEPVGPIDPRRQPGLPGEGCSPDRAEARVEGQPCLLAPLGLGGPRAARRPGLPSRRCQYAAREPAQPNRSAVVFRVSRVAALFYSLVESAKLAGVEPRAYLRKATLRAVRNLGTATLARDLKSPYS